MSDLRTELQEKVLPAFQSLKFDDEGPQELHVVEPKKVHHNKDRKPSVSTEVFEFLKANPAKYTAAQVSRKFGARGYKTGSVAALASQMVRSGSLRSGAGGLLSVVGEARGPLPDRRANKRQKPVPKRALTTGVDLESMTLRQLRELYNELKALFGER
jgi:hypothetical protein